MNVRVSPYPCPGVMRFLKFSAIGSFRAFLDRPNKCRSFGFCKNRLAPVTRVGTNVGKKIRGRQNTVIKQ